MLWTHCSPAVSVPVSVAMVVRETDTRLMGSCATITARTAMVTIFLVSIGGWVGVAG